MVKIAHLSLIVIFTLAAGSLHAGEAATRMSRDELAAFLPGTEVSHISRAGSQRRWKNEADGKFVASSDNKKLGSAMGTSSASAPGTWRVSEDGKYCIQIDWRREAENWCAPILKGADGAYYLSVADDAHRIEFLRR